MRTINADEMVKRLEEWNTADPMDKALYNFAMSRINEQPTVQTEPQWIQCSETVDIPDHEILACDKYGEEMFGYLAYEDNQWLCVSDDCMMYDPIAWREKPEPYQEEGE